MHQSRQTLRGCWGNATIVLLQTSIQSYQLLRGSYLNANAILLQINIQSRQPLRSGWRNTNVILLQTRINHVNKYAVDGSMQPLFLLRTRINHTKRYAVVDIIVIFRIVDLPKTRGILSPICIIFNKDCLFPKTSKGDAPYGTSPQHESKI